MAGDASRIDADKEFPLRLSSEVPRRSSPLALSPLRLIDGLQRRSLSYNKLPEEPIKLSVLKLDGSSFDIEVMKTATVGELKLSVESVFSHMPKKGPGKISWPHLWGQFCLCYEGHKLITETEYISNFGIKDGDQLQFIRHISNDYILMKRLSKNRASPLKQLKLSLSIPKTRKEKLKKHEEDDIRDDLEGGRFRNHNNTSTEIFHRNDCSFIGGILRGWLSYSIFQSTKGAKHGSLEGSSRKHRTSFFCGFKKVIGMFGVKCHSKKDKRKRRLLSNA